MNHEQLQKAIEAAQNKARELGVSISVAIVDDHGSLLAFERMNGALKISPKFAITKAYTASMIGMSTKDIAPFTEEGKPYFGLNSLFGGRLTTIAGGVPIKSTDKLIGGVGVGGSTDVNQDHECAMAAVEVL